MGVDKCFEQIIMRERERKREKASRFEVALCRILSWSLVMKKRNKTALRCIFVSFCCFCCFCFTLTTKLDIFLFFVFGEGKHEEKEG